MEELELISKIRARTPETQVVLFAGDGSPEIEREALRRGAVDYWEKKIKIPAIIERIKSLGIPAGHERG